MNDCDLYAHPNVDGSGCPCGRIVVLRTQPPPKPVAALPEGLWAPLPPILAVIRGDAPREKPKPQLRTRLSSLRPPAVWA